MDPPQSLSSGVSVELGDGWHGVTVDVLPPVQQSSEGVLEESCSAPCPLKYGGGGAHT